MATLERIAIDYQALVLFCSSGGRTNPPAAAFPPGASAMEASSHCTRLLRRFEPSVLVLPH